ncbi:MAG: flagellar basal body P-ring formation protein FlgA [Hyphomicrobiales bacterium]|nr:flagellar basal body P-ring formation protein FlgA [Hyphomicrobiales bacterium]
MRIRCILAAAIAALGVTGAASAQAEPQPVPLLKPEIEVTAELVTLGDLFENAGLLSEKAVFRAPDIGTWGNVSASDVATAAKAAGLENFDLGGLTETRVVRSSRHVSADDIVDFLDRSIAATLGIGNRERLAVTLDLPPAPFYADPSADQPMVLVDFNMSRVNGRFEASIRPSRPGKPTPFTVTGTAIEKTVVAVLTRTLHRGEVVRLDDIAMRFIPVNQASDTETIGPADVVGRAARRSLTANTPIRAADFREPNLVGRNELVMILYKTGGLTLTARGRALSDGIEGSIIDVRNEQSKKTVQATVTAPGVVTVALRSRRLANVTGIGQ